MKQKPAVLNLGLLRKVLIVGDDIMHFIVALTLLACAGLVLARTLPNLLHPDIQALLHILNDVLLVLIIMELMWPIVRFLKRKPFTLKPFLYIGIISSIRRILLIEAEHSLLAQGNHNDMMWATLWPVLVELGVMVGIILMLAVALRLVSTKEVESES